VDEKYKARAKQSKPKPLIVTTSPPLTCAMPGPARQLSSTTSCQLVRRMDCPRNRAGQTHLCSAYCRFDGAGLCIAAACDKIADV